MKQSSLSVASLAMANVLPFMAAASELKPLQAGTFVLGTHTASIHYTVSGDTFEVVTTVAPDPETAGAEVRRDLGGPREPAHRKLPLPLPAMTAVSNSAHGSGGPISAGPKLPTPSGPWQWLLVA